MFFYMMLGIAISLVICMCIWGLFQHFQNAFLAFLIAVTSTAFGFTVAYAFRLYELEENVHQIRMEHFPLRSRDAGSAPAETSEEPTQLIEI